MSVLTQIVGVFPGQEATIQAHLSRFDIVKPTPGGSQIQPRNFNVSAKGKAVPGPDVLAVTVPLTSALDNVLIQEELGFTMRLSRRGGRTVHLTSNGTSYVRLVSDRLRINSIVTLEGTRLDTEWRTGAITYVSAARVRTWFMNDSDPFANFDTTQTYYYSSNYDAGGGTVPTLGSRVRGEGAIVTASGETKMGSAEAAIATDDTGPYTSTCFFEVTSNGCCYSYTYESSAQTTTVTACSNGYGRSLHQGFARSTPLAEHRAFRRHRLLSPLLRYTIAVPTAPAAVLSE